MAAVVCPYISGTSFPVDGIRSLADTRLYSGSVPRTPHLRLGLHVVASQRSGRCRLVGFTGFVAGCTTTCCKVHGEERGNGGRTLPIGESPKWLERVSPHVGLHIGGGRAPRCTLQPAACDG